MNLRQYQVQLLCWLGKVLARDRPDPITAGNKLTDAQRAEGVGTVLQFYKGALVFIQQSIKRLLFQ